jgi:hypothetical protein
MDQFAWVDRGRIAARSTPVLIPPMIDIPPELTAALELLTPAARLDLLRALINPETGRAERIRRLYERDEMRHVAELLIDLEADPLARGLVIEALRLGQLGL